jgi:hypothetical protein
VLSEKIEKNCSVSLKQIVGMNLVRFYDITHLYFLLLGGELMVKPHLVLIGFEETVANHIQNQMRRYAESLHYVAFADALESLNHYNTSLTLILIQTHGKESGDAIHYIPRLLKSLPLATFVAISSNPSLQEAKQLENLGVQHYWDNSRLSPDLIKQKLKHILLHMDVKHLFTDYLKRNFIRVFDFNRRVLMTYEFLLKSCKQNRTITEDQVLGFLPKASSDNPSFDQLLKFVEKEVSRINTTMKMGKVLVLTREDELLFKMANIIDQDLEIIVVNDMSVLENHSRQFIEIDMVLVDENCIQDDCVSKVIEWFPNSKYVLLVNNSSTLDTFCMVRELSMHHLMEKQESASLFCDKVYELLELNFVDSLLDLFVLQSVDKQADYELRKHLVDIFSKQRRLISASIKMGEIYMFLPELRNSHIPDDVLIPESISYPHISGFVDKLQMALPSFNPGA